MYLVNKKIILILFLLCSSLFGALNDKSAMVYYGKKISYPMVGVHDYIIVQPTYINSSSHGFSLYKDKMYAYISIGEMARSDQSYGKIQKEWIIAENKNWDSVVLNIKDREYHQFLFEKMVEPLLKRGFKNFFFDTLDSYQIAAKNLKERAEYEEELAYFINTFHQKYPDAKLIINRGFEVIDKVHDSVEAVLFESYVYGLGSGTHPYKNISEADREWLNIHLNKIKSYKLPIIAVDYLDEYNMDRADTAIDIIKNSGMIPYVSNRDLDIYGKSSKNALKREVFTLIDEQRLDRSEAEAHQYGATVLEYMGYMQKLYDINNGLPALKDMMHYAGVVVWLQDKYHSDKVLIEWIVSLQKIGLKVMFANNFAGIEQMSSFKLLKKLGIEIKKVKVATGSKVEITTKDKMIGYEIEPSISAVDMHIVPSNAEELLVYRDDNKTSSTLAAIMPWGGYAVNKSFIMGINRDNLWVINPYEFFIKSLRLKPLIVPDTTTQNGKRLLFTHIDGDGIMNRVEWDKQLYSGDTILEHILKGYNIPHSVSVIGAEINPEGLFPKLSDRMIAIVKDMYALENVEAATHTYTHPFYWGKIKNENLIPEYRLKVKNYDFSLYKELRGSIDEINAKLIPDNRPEAKTVFWSGDCTPRENALTHIYENGMLNINGGDTTISNTTPWLSAIAPMGLERGEYYQIYTGAQNENVYTNNWLGPFWGFKRVVQTFKLTDSPKRYKPIDIYYHIYSGSKRASLNALKYVFDWAIAQDVMPIYTSEYIPKVMDYYTASIAQEDNRWLVSGMNDLKTLRIEKERAGVDLKESNGVLGVKHFETHTYLHLDNSEKHIVSTKDTKSYKKRAYLVSANAKVVDSQIQEKKQRYSFDGYVDLKLEFNVPKGCSVNSTPKATETLKGEESKISLYFKNSKKAVVNVLCEI